MDRFVKLAVLAVVLYFGVTKVVPWMKQELGGGGARDFSDVGEGSGQCVAVAEAANRDFGVGIGQFSRPPKVTAINDARGEISIDVESWDRVERQLRSSLRDAESACSCPGESCDKAREALDKLRSMLYDYDAGFRGRQPVPLNPARGLQRVGRLLSEARSLGR